MTDQGIYLSVIIPVYNGAEQLPASLDAVATYAARQSQPVELILVDDHRDRATAALPRDFAAPRPLLPAPRYSPKRG